MQFLRRILQKCPLRTAIPTQTRSTAISLTQIRLRAFCDSKSESKTLQFADVPGVSGNKSKFVMLYTCKVCETRAAKTISKHAYYHGVVLIRCPKCENLHLIADRLQWFGEESTDIESILEEKGEKVRYVTEDNVLEWTKKDVNG